MKTSFYILYMAIAMSMVACGGSRQKPVNADSPITETVTDTITTLPALMENGIGSIALGMPASDIPDSIPGLYNRVEKYEGKSFIGYSFVMDSTETFNAEDTDFNGKINLIALRGESPLRAATGNGPVYIGMPESALLDPKGDTFLHKENGGYRIGHFKVQVQDQKVSEIYIEQAPSTSNE